MAGLLTVSFDTWMDWDFHSKHFFMPSMSRQLQRGKKFFPICATGHLLPFYGFHFSAIFTKILHQYEQLRRLLLKRWT